MEDLQLLCNWIEFCYYKNSKRIIISHFKNILKLILLYMLAYLFLNDF